MKPIPPEIIAAAIEILGTDDITVDAIESKVGALVADPMEARRLIDWIPEAFGMVLVAHMGKPVWPARFSALNSQGEDRLFPFRCEPIFVAALPLAQEVYHHGPRSLFQNIALRSSIAGAANNLLNAGGSLDGAVMSGPALFGIPAEVYPPQADHFFLKFLPLWKRLLAWYYRRIKNHRRNSQPPR